MLHRALTYCLAVGLLTACTGEQPASHADDAGDDGSDVQFIVVDAGPQRPTTATITTPPRDMVVGPNDAPSANTIPIVVDIEGRTPDSVQIAVNGTPEDVLRPPYHYEWDISGRRSGEYRLSAWAILDGHAYPGPRRSITIEEDGFANVSPTILTPASRRSVDRNLNVRVQARGLATTAQYTLLRDGEPLADTSSSALADFELDTTGWSEGATTLQARLDVGDQRFWSLPRNVEVIHESSPRFDALGDSLGPWQAIELEVGPDGRLYAALTGQDAIEVQAWSDEEQTWQALGRPLDDQWQPGLPDLEVAPDGTLMVAWIQPDGDEPWNYRRNAHAARWDPDQRAWVPMGDWLEGNREHDASSARLWVDPSGVPHVAFATQDWSGQNAVEVVRWDTDTSAWQPMGDRLTAPARAGIVALSPDPDGRLHLVWRANFQVFTHRFDTDAARWEANALPTVDGFAGDAVWLDNHLTLPLFDRRGFRVVAANLLTWQPLDAGELPAPNSIGAVGGTTLDDRSTLIQTWLKYDDVRDLHASRWVDGRWEPLATRPIESVIDADVLSASAAAGQGRLFVGYIVQDGTTQRAQVLELNELSQQ